MFKRNFNVLMEGEPGGGGGGGGDGGGGAFLESIPAEYRDAVTKAGLKDVGTLVKNWADAQSALGHSIRIPSADASADAMRAFEARLAEKVPTLVRLPGDEDADGWKSFHTRLGVPDAPTGYKFEIIEGVPQEAQQQLDDWFSKAAHKAAVPAKAANAIRAEWMETIKGSVAQQQEQLKAGEAELRKQWGSGYDQRVLMVKNLLNNTKAPELAEMFSSDVLHSNPQLAVWLAERALDYGEDKLVPNGGDRIPSTLRDLESQIADVRGNRTHPYHDSKHPGHKQAVAKMLNLQEQVLQLRGTPG